jgi:hypothetical protein
MFSTSVSSSKFECALISAQLECYLSLLSFTSFTYQKRIIVLELAKKKSIAGNEVSSKENWGKMDY